MVNVNWGGSGIEKVVYDWIVINIPIGSNIIELGAGHVSTNVLRHEYKLTSIDEEIELSFNLGELLKRKPVFYTDGDFFCVI